MAVGDAVNQSLALNASYTPAAGVTVMITSCAEGSSTGGMCNNTDFHNLMISTLNYTGLTKIFVTNSAPITQRSAGSGAISGIQVV